MRVALLGLLFASYFGSLWLAALHFPHPYDWRRNVISNLLSPRDNPQWHWVASAGVAVAGICMAPLAGWIESELEDGRLARRVRRPAFMLGIGCLILSAVVAPRHAVTIAGLRHLHEILARTSAACLGLGMICACAGVPAGSRLRIVWWGITMVPLAGGAGSCLVVLFAWLHGGAAATAYFRGTVFWRLAFWEWTGSAAVFLFFASGAVMLGRRTADGR